MRDADRPAWLPESERQSETPTALRTGAVVWSMIRKSVERFSEKIMRKQKAKVR